MKKQSSTAFFVLSLIVVLAAAAQVVVRVAMDSMAGRAEAATEFQELGAILSPVKTAADLERPELRAKLADYYRRSSSVLFVSVYERGSGVKWRIPADSVYLPASANAAPMPKPTYPDQSSILFAASLPSDVSGKLAVDALYVTLRQESVFLALRDSGLAVAAWLVLAGIVGLALSLGHRGRKTAGESAATEGRGEVPVEGEGDASAGTMDGNAAADMAISVGATDTIPDLEDFAMEAAEPEKPDYGFGNDEFEIPELAESPLEAIPDGEDAEEALDLELPEIEEVGGTAPDTATESAPGGLYSPLSGLGWESYLSDRLDSELSRSASFEQDLSLLLIAYEGLSPERGEYKVIAKAVSDFFSFKDLAFERGPDGFAVILPNVDADHGIRMAEEFLKKLTFILAKDRPLSYIPVFMGLSSRSGRLVDSVRLGQEAQAALQRARDEHDSHIIAFKPDPDRYRIYLASKAL